MTKHQLDAIISFIAAMVFLLIGLIAFNAGNTSASIGFATGAVYYLIWSSLEYSKQKYDQSGKPV